MTPIPVKNTLFNKTICMIGLPVSMPDVFLWVNTVSHDGETCHFALQGASVFNESMKETLISLY